MSVAQVDALLQPYLANLTKLGIGYQYSMVQFPDFQAEYTETRDVFHFAVGLGQAGGYLVPRSFFKANNSALTTVVRQIVNATPPGGLGRLRMPSCQPGAKH